MILKIKDSLGYLWQMLEKQLIILKTSLERGGWGKNEEFILPFLYELYKYIGVPNR